jgi:ribosomal protein L32
MWLINLIIAVFVIWILLGVLARFTLKGVKKRMQQTFGNAQDIKTTELVKCPKCGVFVDSLDDHVCEETKKEN